MMMMTRTAGLLLGPELVEAGIAHTHVPLNAEFRQGTKLGATFAAKNLPTSSTMMLTSHHAKCHSAAIADIPLGPLWGGVGLEHGLGLANGGKLPALGLHEVEGFL